MYQARLSLADRLQQLHGVRLGKDNCLSCGTLIDEHSQGFLPERCSNRACNRPFPHPCVHQDCSAWVQPSGGPKIWYGPGAECRECEEKKRRDRRVQPFMALLPAEIIVQFKDVGSGPRIPPVLAALETWFSNPNGAAISCINVVGPHGCDKTAAVCWTVARALWSGALSDATYIREHELLSRYAQYYGTPAEVRARVRDDVEKLKMAPLLVLDGVMPEEGRLSKAQRVEYAALLNSLMEHRRPTLLTSVHAIASTRWLGPEFEAKWTESSKTIRF